MVRDGKDPSNTLPCVDFRRIRGYSPEGPGRLMAAVSGTFGRRMAAETSVKLVIPSRVHLVDLVHSAAEKIAEIAGFDDDEVLNIGLAVRETVVNAIKHGNGEDVSKEVEILLEVTGRGLRVRIQDGGAGFDPESTADPTAEDNLLQTSGRGLLLIRAFVDDVRFNYKQGRGMEVTLEKALKTG